MSRQTISTTKVIALVITVLVIWAVSARLVWLSFDSAAERGQFGDMFGSVNALFSGLAFLVLILSMWLQRDELNLQRQELAETRAVMEEQKKEFSLQNSLLRLQTFEATFFQWLGLHHKIVESLRLREHENRKVFEHLHSETNGQYQNSMRSRFNQELNDFGRAWTEKKGFDLEIVKQAYYGIYSSYRGHLAHYFRNLYNIVRFIDQAEGLNADQRRFYTNIVRAQLSSFELALLFYNGLSEWGSKFKGLMEKYGLFNNLEDDLLFQRCHREYYEPGAFEGSKLQIQSSK